ncbi:MAG: hypothetical protein JWM33_3595 [Caulobacteraceae bacterium]|nr:hypothetical protein [Caulobacteraceae bacterium]
MSDSDEKLSALLRADLPPERDAVFRLEVMRRLEMRALVQRSIGLAVLGLAAMALVALLAPFLPDARRPAVQIVVCTLVVLGGLVFAYAPRRSL